MSAKGRPEREQAPERASAEGSQASAKGRPEREQAPERASAACLMSGPLEDLAQAIRSGATTATAAAEAQLARIDATEEAVGAWETLDRTHVMRAAAAADAALPAGPLAGVGIGIKDIIATVALPTTVGSVIYADYRPEADAACVAHLRACGAYVFGKTVTTPFAFLDPGRTRNPHRREHTPGGSSSGSAAAVAAGHVTGAVGTQTNGSVIRPAAYCGVVGYKPTVGAIPVQGMHPFSPTFDTIGTFARSVSDAALLARALTDDPRVPARIEPPAHRPRLAWLARFPWSEPDAATARVLAQAVDRLGAQAEVVPIVLPAAWDGAQALHRLVMMREGFEVLGELQARERARLTPALNAAIDEGRAIRLEDYRAACVERERAIAFFTGWLDEFDAVLSPAAPGVAPRGLETTGDPACCTLWSLLGFPAVTVPAGVVDGLPAGLQLGAPQARDASLLAAALWAEALLPPAPVPALP